LADKKRRTRTALSRIWNASKKATLRRRARRPLACEPLEDRRVLSSATLSGVIYQDLAKSGSYNSQAGVNGAAIELYDTTANTVESAVTGINGSYSLTFTAGDTCYAVVRAPFGYTQFTSANVGDANNLATTGKTVSNFSQSTTLNVGLYGAPVSYGFAEAFGGGSSVVAGTQGSKLATDSSGNVYVTGWFQNSVNFDPGPGVTNLASAGGNDVFVAKYSPTGALVWADDMGGGDDDRGYGIAVDPSGNVYTTGYFTGNATVAQFDPHNASDSAGQLTAALGTKGVFISALDTNGNFHWAKTLTQSGGSGYDDEAYNIKFDSANGSGDIVVGGFFTSTVSATISGSPTSITSAGSTDIFVATLSSSGSFLFLSGYGGSGSDQMRGMSLSSDGTAVYSTGVYENSVTLTTASGTTTLQATGSYDVFVTKFVLPTGSNLSGSLSWATSLGSTGDNESHGIAVDGNGDSFVTGFFNGNGSAGNPGTEGAIFVSEVSPGGTVDWTTTESGTGSGRAISRSGAALDIGGYFSGTVDFNPVSGSPSLTSTGTTDGFVAQFNPTSGQCQWLVGLGSGGSNDDEVDSIGINSSGCVYATGVFQGTASIPGTSFTAQGTSGSQNGFLIMLGPPGTNPTVTIDAAGANGTPITTSTSPINFTVAFSAPVENFAAADVTFGGTAPGTLTKVVSSTGATTYNVAVSGMTGNGTVIATIAASAVQDPYGDYNSTSMSTGDDNTVTYSGGPSFALTGPSSGTYSAGVSVTIQWTAANVDTAGPTKITLGYDPDAAVFDAGQQWIEVNQGTAANGAGSYTWNTTGTAPGTYYLDGYMYDFSNGSALCSHVAAPIVIAGAAPPCFTLAGPSAGTFIVGKTVTIQWTAANVDTAGPTKITLGYDSDSAVFDANQQWIEINGVTAANGAGSYTWNTTGTALGTYYLDGYMYDFSTGKAVFSHVATPIVIGPPPVFTLTGPTAGTFTAGNSVTLQWTAANVNVGGPTKITLGYDADATVYDSNQHWLEVDGVTAANGAGSCVWNTANVTPGTYYLDGYMYDCALCSAEYSNLTAPIVIQPNYGTIIAIASFNGTNGRDPMAGLIEDASGNLFGTVFEGGAYGYGTVFEIKAGSGSITTLASFNGTNGSEPAAGLIEDASGNLFGTTANGSGTVFEIKAGSGSITTLATFDGLDGYGPGASLIEDAHGNLFGTTSAGGAYGANGGDGTVFELKAGSGSITVLASFNGTNGQSPLGLIEDASGDLFGTTYEGGASDIGTVFEIKAGSGSITTLASFNGTNGDHPTGLVEDASGNLFGTADGGASGDGTVFEIKAGSGSITTLASFNGTTGQWPEGLIEDAHGNLLGTTDWGGVGGYGTVFELKAGSGSITTLAGFNGTNGENPLAGLIEDAHGDLFGTASGGGPNADGTVFEFVPAAPVAAPAFTLTGPTAGTFVAGASVTIGWTAANVDTAGPAKISLGYDADATPFDANQHWAEVDQVVAANGAASYTWNTAGMVSGTYYLSGYMYDFTTGQQVLSSLGTSIVITGGAAPAFTLTGPTAGTFVPGASVTIGWTAANVDAAGPTKITLGYDPDATAFDSNEHWIEIDGGTAANGGGSYVWNTGGVAAGTYYLSGYMYDFSVSQAVYSHLGTSIVIT